MRDFGIVFGYELRSQLTKKTTRVVTLVLALIMLAATSVPRIIALFDSGKPQQETQQKAVISDAGYVADAAVLQEIAPLLGGAEYEKTYNSREDLVAALKKEEIKVGFVIQPDLSYEAVYQDRSMESDEAATLEKLLTQAVKNRLLDQKGLSAADLSQIEDATVSGQTTVMGKNSMNSFGLSLALMILVYMIVLIYGNSVSTVIAREKDSRTMEILITSTRPGSLILGKVAASGVAAIVQFGFIILVTVIGYQFNKQFYPPIVHMMLAGALTPSYIWTYLFFTITGYVMYLFLFAALGSTVSKMEDVGSATAIVQFIFIFAYLISSFAMNMPTSPVAVIGSIVPLTSIMVMPLRAALITVPISELLLSGALMLVFVVFFAFLSIKIYRWGSLNYGNKTRLTRIVKEALRGQH